MMRVAEWGTILVTCKRATLKMQTLMQSEFNSVPTDTKISHLLIQRKLISAFSPEVLFLLNKQTKRTNETDKVSWRIMLGGWKAAEVTGRLPNTRKDVLTFLLLRSLYPSSTPLVIVDRNTFQPHVSGAKSLRSSCKSGWSCHPPIAAHLAHPLPPIPHFPWQSRHREAGVCFRK